MNIRGIPLLIARVRAGEFGKIIDVLRFYGYRMTSSAKYFVYRLFHPVRSAKRQKRVRVDTKHPVAFSSPDHIVPWGTKHDNTSHAGFVLNMHMLLGKAGKQPSMLDLGCAGGQLVREFLDIGWFALGLEGSDYSLKHKRANWATLARRNLFTADIAKPFTIRVDGERQLFTLITAWEVVEHIRPKDLKVLFANIVKHLAPGGYFIASTTSLPDVRGGIDLHQTKMTNRQWHLWIRKHIPRLAKATVGLQFYQYVRYNAERSFLVYQKRLI